MIEIKRAIDDDEDSNSRVSRRSLNSKRKQDWTPKISDTSDQKNTLNE